MSNRRLSHWNSWKTISKNDALQEGMIVKGYTYFPGDFRGINLEDKSYAQKRFYGMPKLRVGVIVEKYSNNYFKVQFRNSKAKKDVFNKFGVNLVNSFDLLDSKTERKIGQLRGMDSFCMIVKRNTLYKYFKNGIVKDIDKEAIRKKHSGNKKRTEKRFFLNGDLSKLNREKINLVLKKYQFTKAEITLTPERVIDKMECILKRHNSKRIFCVPKELKKTHKMYVDNKELFKSKNYDIRSIETSMAKEWMSNISHKNKADNYVIGYLKSNSLIPMKVIKNFVSTFKIWKNSEKLTSTKESKKLLKEVETIEEGKKSPLK